MIEVKTKQNQTIFDIAVQHYGDVSLFDKVFEDNPHIENDYSFLVNKDIVFDYDSFDFAMPLKPGQTVFIDPLKQNRAVLFELKDIDVVSFDISDLETL